MSGQAQVARSLLAVNRYDDAVKAVAQGLTAAPDDGELHCLLALAHIRANRPNDALKAATDAVRVEPADEWPHRLRSIALRQLKRKEESVDEARESVRLEPSLAVAHQNLGDAYIADGDADSALVEAGEALRLEPGSADAHNLAGRCLLRKNKPKEAEDAFRRALELDPNDAIIHNNLGVALQRQGRRVEAVNAFNAAAKIDPSSELARRNLYSGTRALIGGGSLLFAGYLLVRALAVFGGSGRYSVLFAGIAIAGVGGAIFWFVLWFVRRARLRAAGVQLAPTAIAYYRAERKRLRREGRPLMLIRLGALVIAIVALFTGLLIQAVPLVILGLAVAAAGYWLGPVLLRRIRRA